MTKQYFIFKLNDTKLTLANTAEVKSELKLISQAGYSSIIMDLSNVKRIDSSGLTGLIIGHKLCKDTGGICIMTNLDPVVYRLIVTSQLNTIFSIVDTVDDGILLLKAIQAARAS